MRSREQMRRRRYPRRSASESAPVILTPTTLQASATESPPGGDMSFAFDGQYEVGQYVVGDYFAVIPSGGDFGLSGTTPPSEVSTDPVWINTKLGGITERAIHGMQKDWHFGAVVQDIDSEEFTGLDGSNQTPTPYPDPGSWSAFEVGYVPQLNVDPGVTGADLILNAPATLIKARSLPGAETGVNNRPSIRNLVFLTVVDTVPPIDSFRPPADAGDKISHYRKSQINPAVLPRLQWPVGQPLPDHAALAAKVARPNYNQSGRFDQQRGLLASENEASYGEAYAAEMGAALAALCSDDDYSVKEPLALAICQAGIDTDGLVLSGQFVKSADGNSTGHKFAYVAASILLQDAAMQARAGLITKFSADAQIALINLSEFVNLERNQKTVRPQRPYPEDMVGIPEFSGQHYVDGGVLAPAGGPARAGSHWEMSYRGLAQVSQLTAAVSILHMTNGAGVWNNEIYWNYLDRWFGIEKHEGTPNPFWALWRPLASRPIYLAPPEMMEDYTLISRTEANGGDYIIQRPGFTTVQNGGDILVSLGTYKHRNRDLDALLTYDLRWSSNGGLAWNTITNVSMPYEFQGPLNSEIYIQMRATHPVAGQGPWSFEWGFYEEAETPEKPVDWVWPDDNNEFRYPSVMTDAVAQRPLNYVAPTFDITSTAGELNSILTDGAWISADTITYEWWDNDVPIPGADGLAYAGVAGQLLSSVVVATNAEGPTIYQSPPVAIVATAPPYGEVNLFHLHDPGSAAEYTFVQDVGDMFLGRKILLLPSSRGGGVISGFEIDVNGVAADAIPGGVATNVGSQAAGAFEWNGGGKDLTFKVRPTGGGDPTRCGLIIMILSGAEIHDIGINPSHSTGASVDVEGPNGIVVGFAGTLAQATEMADIPTVRFSDEIDTGVWHTFGVATGLATQSGFTVNPGPGTSNEETIAIALKPAV